MRMKFPPLTRLLLVLLVGVPLAAWAFVKPVRVVAPALLGFHCSGHGVCVETEAHRPQAQRLYDEAMSFVAGNVGPVGGAPRFIFCSNEACATSFGLGQRSAVTVGTVGSVIGPRAWTAYYVRHELIHHVQAQQFDTLPLLLKPAWLTEGMAYSLSQDPRTALMEPFQGYRQQFEAWYATVGKSALWQQARML